MSVQIMAHHILETDLPAILRITCGDVTLQSIDGVTQLRVPMFYADGPGYIVTVKLHPDQRPYIEWSSDQSQMHSQYTQDGSRDAFFEGTYALVSQQEFVVTISEGVPSRPDFVRHTSDNRAWCCAEAKSFTLADPSFDNKISTFVQVSDSLLMDCSQNGKGKVFLWRRA